MKFLILASCLVLSAWAESQHHTSGFVAHLNGAVVPQDTSSVLQQKQLHATAHANAASNGYEYPQLPYANLAAYPNVQVKEQDQPHGYYYYELPEPQHHTNVQVQEQEQPHGYYYYEQPEPQHHTSGFVKHLNGAVVPQDTSSVLQQKELHANTHSTAASNGYKYPLIPYANLAAYPNVQVKEQEQSEVDNPTLVYAHHQGYFPHAYALKTPVATAPQTYAAPYTYGLHHPFPVVHHHGYPNFF